MGANFSAGNNCFVRTDKPVYVSGESVTGTINLNCTRQFPSQGVFLIVKGVERCKWVERRTRQVPDGRDENGNQRYRTEEYFVDHHGRNRFFDVRIPVYPFQNYCLPGQYSFPFSFQLPAGLPGTFSEAGERWGTRYEAETSYFITGDIHCADGSEIRHQQRLIVYEKLMSEIQAVALEKTANIYVCCCINRGSVHMESTFDKNAYVSGETAQVVCKVQNNSTSDITAIKTKLRRRIVLRSDAGATFNKVETLNQGTYAGVAKAQEVAAADGSQGLLDNEQKTDYGSAEGGANKDGEKSEVVRIASESGDRYVPVNLSCRDWAYIQPSTNGQMIRCNYWVEVDACVTCSGGISLELPVTIYEPQPATWEVPVPAGWNPTMYDTAQVVIPAASAVANAAVNVAANVAANVATAVVGAPGVQVQVSGQPAYPAQAQAQAYPAQGQPATVTATVGYPVATATASPVGAQVTVGGVNATVTVTGNDRKW